ncbi:MAG: carboxymuconolactone decarboxylase family protein [Candidatus Dormibacterales bacterium]
MTWSTSRSKRASQTNGCSACVEFGLGAAGKSGESLERLVRLPAWSDSNCFTDAERAVLAITEAATRLADRPDSVTDEIWAAAARHYDEKGLAAIIMMVAMTTCSTGSTPRSGRAPRSPATRPEPRHSGGSHETSSESSCRLLAQVPIELGQRGRI